MIDEHKGTKANYQICCAIYYALEKNYDEIAIEGDNFEDSKYYFELDGQERVAIGESKSIDLVHLKFKQSFDQNS